MASQDTTVDTTVPVDAPTPGRRWPRRLKRALRWTLVVVCVLALVAAGLSIWSVRRSFPEYGGTLDVRGLEAPVTVDRDASGIPQIYARSEADLFLAQGYVHAQDRFWEMDFRRHMASGRIAEMFGEPYVATDAFIRTLGWRRVAEQEWRLLSRSTKTALRAYADGVNAWIADHGGRAATAEKSLEYGLLGVQNPDYTVEPWDPIDSLAWMKAMAWNLRSNMDDEMIRATLLAYGLSRDQIKDLYPQYPYTRHVPVLDGAGTTSPAASADRDTDVTDRATRAAAPVIGELARATRTLSGLLGPTTGGIGSNAWAVSGKLTASGKPILANDPHMRPSLPGVWYQVGLHCECSLDVSGFSLAGVPGVLIGHNDRIAWGLTNLGADVSDLYLEKVRGDRYFDGTAWRQLRERREVIEVAGGEPVTINVRATHHGPLLSDRSADLLAVAARPPLDASGSPAPTVATTPSPSLDPGAAGVPEPAESTPYAVALRWTASQPGRTMDALLAVDRASNWKEFRAAAAMFDVPAQNMVYADVEGNIGYQTPGRIPIRQKGKGLWPAPGWDPSYDWQGYIPFDELPTVLNPSDGVIVSANQPPVGRQYPHSITRTWLSYGYRSQRIVDLLGERKAQGKLTVDDMRQIQFDDRNPFAPVLVPELMDVRLDAGKSSTVARARALLKGWNYRQPAESPARTSAAAAFYNATWRHLLLRTFDELPHGSHEPARDDGSWEVVRSLMTEPDSPWWDDKRTAATETMDDMLVVAMNDAAEELERRLGPNPDEWRWGDLHTLALEHDTLGQSGIPPVEWLFNHEPVPVAGGGGLVNATAWPVDLGYDTIIAPSMRMIVDLGDLNRSRWVNLSGVSGHVFHPHYTDQLELWRTGRDLPMRWTRTSVEAAARHSLTMQPASG